ncbi:MAG: AAA family ATPase [Gammaproteobacteria bacterium]|nr:AAA family ATPase [Gammaproteobacteria bacterium]
MTIIEDAVKHLENKKSPKKAPVERKIDDTVAEVVLQPDADDTGEYEMPAGIGAGAERVESTGRHRIVQVDSDALRAAGFLAPEDDERQLVDQYRNIKRPLLAHAFGKRATRIPDGHLVLITSALSGEGKSFTCINLALSLAHERDHKVLLVDADVAKPHISKLFGADAEPGLLDLLDSDRPVDHRDFVVPTSVPGLSLLPAGKARTYATELLASNRMEELMRALGKEDPQRIVVFDSPPVLLTSEARVLTRLVGQVVVVVLAGMTPQQAVLEAVDTIDEGKAVNLILNQARHSADGGYYGGSYGYGSRRQENDNE